MRKLLAVLFIFLLSLQGNISSGSRKPAVKNKVAASGVQGTSKQAPKGQKMAPNDFKGKMKRWRAKTKQAFRKAGDRVLLVVFFPVIYLAFRRMYLLSSGQGHLLSGRGRRK